MTYCFYMAAFLVLVIIQTAIMPYFSFLVRFYDLVIPFIVFLSIFRPFREGLFAVLCFGLVMDGISGGYPGLYLTVYFWLFIIIRCIIKFIHVSNRGILPFVVAAGVLIGSIIFFGISAMFEPDLPNFSIIVRTVGIQVLWAIFTGYFLLIGFIYAQKRLDRWLDLRAG